MTENNELKPYDKPELVTELDLETRAGSPLFQPPDLLPPDFFES